MTKNYREAGKREERILATTLQAAAGRVRDPVLEPLVTVTGRVGHLTELGFDVLVGNTEEGTAMVGESKRRKATLGADAMRALIQIFRIGVEWMRTPVMGFTLADDAPQYVDTRRGKARLERRWVLLPLPFAEELIYARRYVAECELNDRFNRWMIEQQEQAKRVAERAPAAEVVAE